MWSFERYRAAAMGFLWCASCAGSSASKDTAHIAPADITAELLYPLHEGCAWSYDVDSGDGQPVLATVRVLRADTAGVDVQTGQAVQRYAQSAQGIQRAGQRYFLLHSPFVSGAHWPSSADAEARVIATEQTVSTPAGNFPNCVVVREEHTSSLQQVTTTYCVGVGPVRIESQMEVRGRVIRVIAALRGYNTEQS
ncbi:MAG: hypothetical protein RL701_1323 [Pseudomonadota bacterium]